MVKWLFTWPQQDLVALETELLQRGRVSILKLLNCAEAVPCFEKLVDAVVASPEETRTQVLALWRSHLVVLADQAHSPIREMLLVLGIGRLSYFWGPHDAGLILGARLAQRFPIEGGPVVPGFSLASFGSFFPAPHM